MTEETLRRHRPLGKHLAELRHARGLSVGDVAEEVGCKRQHIYLIETGRCGVSHWMLPKLAILYGADLAALEAMR